MNFVYGTDASVPATEEQMAEVYGDGWRTIKYGDLAVTLNELFGDSGWVYEVNDHQRYRDSDKGRIIVETSLRCATSFMLFLREAG